VRDLRRIRAGWCEAWAVIALTAGLSGSAHAQSFLEVTHLVDVSLGSGLAQTVSQYKRGGYRLSDGKYVDFERWYSSKWRDLGITVMTEVNQNFGVFWGVSTGERGPKYEILPALKIGFILQKHLSEQSILSFSAITSIGGNLTEKACVADYGQIGGTQTVNCRLAASTLPPSVTLKYMFDQSPPDRTELRLNYIWFF
jgi:hypothetical protein